jgi:hypothetical protein
MLLGAGSRFGYFRLGISLQRRATANQVTVAVSVIYTAYGRPEFRHTGEFVRINRFFAGIRFVPVFGQGYLGRVRGIFQYVVFLIGTALFNFSYFFPDSNHGFAETVQFFFGLAFGRLYH